MVTFRAQRPCPIIALFLTVKKMAKQNKIDAPWKLAESCQNTKVLYTVICKVAKFGYLGIALDETFPRKDHDEYVSSKVSRRLGRLPRIRSCLTL